MATTAQSHQYQSFSPKCSERSTPSQLSGSSNLLDASVNPRWGQVDAFSSPSSPGSGAARLKSLTGDGGEADEKIRTRGGKLHRRVASDSTFQRSHQRNLSFPSDNYTPPLSPSAESKRTTPSIKPLLKKLTNTEESNSLDLSRSAVDQEGLGIYALDYTAPNRSAADVSFTSTAKRGGYHARSTSGTSVYSNLTASSRPGGQYVHPMRQTPRPYTPPNAQSYNNSILDSEHSGEGYEDEDQIRRIIRDASYRPHKTPHANTPPLRLQTNLSATRLVHGSQTNLATSSPSVRANGDVRNSPDIMTPTSQKSGFKIRKTDPIMQAESIHAAREAFNAKEREKELKAEKEEMRATVRETRKKEREQERRQKAEATSEAKIKRSMPSSEKPEGLIGQEYANLGPGEILPSTRPGPRPQRRNTSTSAKGNVQSVWVGFMVWLKLRFIKLGRKMGF
jgi:hypothetical protein